VTTEFLPGISDDEDESISGFSESSSEDKKRAKKKRPPPKKRERKPKVVYDESRDDSKSLKSLKCDQEDDDESVSCDEEIEPVKHSSKFRSQEFSLG
jgi:hypothetical protein